MTEELTEVGLTKSYKALAPGGELGEVFRFMEATQTVEDQLALEDAGWINLSTGTETISGAERISNIKLSRLYCLKDPLGKQSIRLWTDYTFGTGMSWGCEEDKVKKTLDAFWEADANSKVLGCAGQRQSSNDLLIDGVVYFAFFLGKPISRIRRIDPLEITEIITDPDDKENELYYRRDWTDPQSKPHTDYYRSINNLGQSPADDNAGQAVKMTQTAIVYRLTYNDANPLLLPALDWIKQYRRFLASRVAMMLALARFAWKTKVVGGQAAVNALKTKTNEKEIAAGSQVLENMGSDTQPIKVDSGARNAYEDARMLRLQVCAAVGIPEQYFGDISSGNLATAKTVELPMVKMFESYQATWRAAYDIIDNVVLAYNGILPGKWHIDRDFPPIAPIDVAEAARALVDTTGVFPQFKLSPDVQQMALLTLGINDPDAVLEELDKLIAEDEKKKAAEPPPPVPPNSEEPPNGEQPEDNTTEALKGLKLLKKAIIKGGKKENGKTNTM